MNLLDLLILGILAFSVIAGMHKGFLTSCLATAGLIGSWFGALAIYPSIANMALSNTSLMGTLSIYLEPENFFSTHQTAMTSVSEVLSGGEEAIRSACASVSSKLNIIGTAFESNIRNQAFQRLNLSTLADYLDQTIWEAVFNLLAFVIAFILLYLLSLLIVNLLDKVIRFPVLRVCDRMVGGVFGLFRGIVITVLILCIVPELLNLASPELNQTLTSGSQLYHVVKQIDLLGVARTITKLIA